MKKMISIVITLGLFALMYQFFTLLLMNNHDSEYSIKTDDLSYMVKEAFSKNNDFNMYSLQITDKDNNIFVASFNKDINKQSRIIKDIKSYKNNNIYCVAPVLKDKNIEYISCLLDNNQVSVSYLHQIGNNDINNFIDQLKKDNYIVNEEVDKQTVVKKTESNISVYDELDDNLYITMWGYKGVYILNKGDIVFKDLLNNDSYFNDFSILCDKYYVTVNTDESNYNSFFIANIKDGGKASIESEYDISKNIYINGVYKDKVYITDIDNKKQYSISPKMEKIEEVGTSDNCKYFDGKKLNNVNINELTNEKKYFVQNKIDEKIIEKYPNNYILESLGNYYFFDSGNVYQINSNYPDSKVLLFKFDDFKEMKVKNNNIYGISGDTLYMYNNSIGLRKVSTNRELAYNSKNIYDLYISK